MSKSLHHFQFIKISTKAKPSLQTKNLSWKIMEIERNPLKASQIIDKFIKTCRMKNLENLN